MSTVIAFVNQKGGVGKTTLAIHTAWELTRASGNVLLVDADPQGSTSDWASLREATPFGTVSCARPNLDEEVDRLRTAFHWIVIDGPPRQNDIARAAWWRPIWWWCPSSRPCSPPTLPRTRSRSSMMRARFGPTWRSGR